MVFSLRSRIIAAVVGTSFLLTAGALQSISYLASVQAKRAVEKDADSTSAALRDFLRREGNELRLQAALLSRIPVLMSVVQANDLPTIQDRVDFYHKELGVTAIVVTDSQGIVTGSTDRSLHRKDLGRNPFIAAAAAGASRQGLAHLGGSPVVASTVPIEVGDYVQATLTLETPIDDELARSIAHAVGSDVAFFRDHQLLGSSRGLASPSPQTWTEPTVFHEGGEPMIGLYSKLQESGGGSTIGFVTFRPYGPVVAPFQELQNRIALSMALSMLIGLLVSLVVSHGVTRPLTGVVRAARTLQRGDWPVPFESQRSDEIGLLERAFDDMTRAVRQSREKLLAMVRIDPLTNLANHRAFKDQLAHEELRAAQEGDGFSVCLFDIDRFARFNQAQGADAGDKILCEIARRLESLAPESSFVSRFGGEEFALILQGSDDKGHESACHCLLDEVSSSLGVTLSAGMACWGEDGKSGNTLLLASELGVAQAKQQGGNRVFRFANNRGELGGATLLQQYVLNGSYATMRALAEAVDAKDTYTNGHSQRVAQYASDLSAWIGTDAEFVDLVMMTGTLHDVGKIGVPDAVLKKADRLTEDERKLMEAHPVLGEKIVSQVPQLAETIPGIRFHHERWDGNGYPDNLAGETIPLIARILAIADTFDAMTSDRPYRNGLGIERALEEIRRMAGIQFDPDLAEAFVAMMGERTSRAA